MQIFWFEDDIFADSPIYNAFLDGFVNLFSPPVQFNFKVQHMQGHTAKGGDEYQTILTAAPNLALMSSRILHNIQHSLRAVLYRW